VARPRVLRSLLRAAAAVRLSAAAGVRPQRVVAGRQPETAGRRALAAMGVLPGSVVAESSLLCVGACCDRCRRRCAAQCCWRGTGAGGSPRWPAGGADRAAGARAPCCRSGYRGERCKPDVVVGGLTEAGRLCVPTSVREWRWVFGAGGHH